MARGYVTVRGMRELTRDLRAVDRGIARQLQKDLKEAVDPTVKLAKVLVPKDKLALQKSIRATASQKQIAIRANKRRKGFLYGAVYEYGGRGGGEYGPRAYLNPALNQTQDKIIGEVARLLSHYLNRYNM